MDHHDIRHKLSEYIDNAVAPEYRAAIDEHLKTCAECAHALAELRKTIEQVRQIDEIESPAWMTSKIMAKVRAEEEQKKSLFHRLFYPLAVKLPIQAVAVLFLTVTVYYIYSGMHPAEKYAEAPRERLAKQEAPAAGADALRRREPEVARQQEKKLKQGPGYRSLDMKYEYEKPAAPVPAEPPSASAPAPAKRAEQAASPQEERTKENRAVAAPSSVAEQAAPASGAALSRKAEPGEGKSEGKSKILSAADKDADDTLDVTEYFVRKDLPEKMKAKGLQFSTRKIREDTPGLQWLHEMPAYRTKPCARRYLVDVEAAGRSYKYLYCYDGSVIRLLGIFEHAHGLWSEKK